MDAQKNIRELIREEFIQIKTRNSNFSLRAFAKKIKISPSALHEILYQGRRITPKMAEKILAGLRKKPDEIKKLSLGCKKISKKSPLPLPSLETEESDETSKFHEIEQSYFEILSEWYHLPILSLLETQNSAADPKWIASRLRIKLHEAVNGIQNLLKVGLLEKTKKGRLIPTGKQFTMSPHTANLALKYCHYQNLESAKNSLENDPVEVRDFSSIVMAIDPSKIPEAKKRIEKFRRSLCDFLEEGEKKEVYRICIQLFPQSYPEKPGIE